MTIGIFLEKFSATELTKDPGLIASGLINYTDKLVIFSHEASREVIESFDVKILSRQERHQVSFWENSGINSLIIYSWLSLRYTELIAAAKKAGIKVILKLDSDGQLLYPSRPSYLKVFGLESNLKAKIIHLIRLGQWHIFPRLISKKKLRQLEMCDAVIIETPAARQNLINSLSYWKRENLKGKIHVVPNPVRDWPAITVKKNNIITAVGRWKDARKNAPALIKVLSSINTSWQIRLIGRGSESVKAQVRKMNPDIQIDSAESLSHQEVLQKLAESRIIFAPSISESYNLAVAEGLCCGCSLVGTPLPSFQYFSNDGTSGILAENSDPSTLAQALIKGISKWEKEEYDAEKIAAFWQQKLDVKTISSKIFSLLTAL